MMPKGGRRENSGPKPNKDSVAICLAYQAHTLLKVIAATYSIHISTINLIVRRAGVPKRGPRPKKKRPLSRRQLHLRRQAHIATRRCKSLEPEGASKEYT